MELNKVFLSVIIVVISFASLVFSHSGDTLYVPYGIQPTIDGQILPGEWDDADTVLLPLPEGPAVVFYKQNPDSLYIAINLTDSTYDNFDNATIRFDCNHNGGNAPQPDDYGFGSHRGGMLVEFIGTGSGWNQQAMSGWNGAIYSSANYWQVEYSISFGKLGIIPGVAKTLGFEVGAGDLGNGGGNWPPGANGGNPNSWGDIVSPDNWAVSDTVPPSVLVLVPNGGEIWNVGEVDTIWWIAFDNTGIDSVNIYYSTNGGTTWLTIATGEPNDSSYIWTIPNTPSDSCLVMVIAFDPNLNTGQDESNSFFTIFADTVPPNINVVQPNGGEVLNVGSVYPIIWYASDSNGVDSVNIYYSTDAGGSWNVVSTGEVNDSVYLWTVPDTPSDSCLVRIIAYDPNLNSAQDESDTLFTITSVGISDDLSKLIPEGRFSLAIFPEPFSNISTIYFSIPKFTHINLSIYDISGKLIRRVYNGSKRAGQYLYTWDGRDYKGGKACPGVYFCKMVTSERTLTRKITLIK